MKTEVCIVGAGPGGASAALKLATLGIECVLVDKAVFPRDKICGDALSGKVVNGLNRIDPEIIPRLHGQPYRLDSWGVTFVAPNGKSLDVPFKVNYDKTTSAAPGFICKRMDFDNFLVEEVKSRAEITLKEGFEVTDCTSTDEGWHITSKAGDVVDARIIIIANGAQSKLMRTIGGIEKELKHYSAGLRAYYTGVEGLKDDGFIELHFLKDFLPGYFWIFPLPNGYANVGVGMRSDVVSKKKVNLKARMEELIATHPEFKARFKNAKLEGSIKGFGLPLGSKKRKISGNGYMLVGDAASLIDPFTGEGISNAIFSGMYAAEQVERCLQTNNVSAAFMQQYDAATYKRLWQELKLSTTMQRLVKYPWLFNLVVNKAKKNKTLGETISCMFDDMDLRERLKKPSFYFKLLFNG